MDGQNFIELRIGLLLYNCDKAGTFEILETIHSVGMAARTPTHRRPSDLSPADLSPTLNQDDLSDIGPKTKSVDSKIKHQ